MTDDEHDDDYEDYGDVNFDGDDDDDEYKNCIYGKKKLLLINQYILCLIR